MAKQAERPVDRFVRLPADLAAQLEAEAARAYLSRGAIIRQAIREFVAARQAERAAGTSDDAAAS